MTSNAVSGSARLICAAASGAVGGGMLGALFGVFTAETAAYILKMKKKNVCIIQQKIMYIASVIPAGVVAGAGGAAYHIGRDVFSLNTNTNCCLALVASAATATLLAHFILFKPIRPICRMRGYFDDNLN